jgi:hypothetical protein
MAAPPGDACAPRINTNLYTAEYGVAGKRATYFSAGVGCGAVEVVVAGAAGCSALGSAPNGSSLRGPLVALMPAAGLDAGTSGKSIGAAFGGAAESVEAADTSVSFASTSLGASAETV